jgi:hypothetical protein
MHDNGSVGSDQALDQFSGGLMITQKKHRRAPAKRWLAEIDANLAELFATKGIHEVEPHVTSDFRVRVGQ